MPEEFEVASQVDYMASSSLEAVTVQYAPANNRKATTEGNSHNAATDSSMEEAATDNSLLACPHCSVLEGSKTHADTGSSNPKLLVVLCTVRIANSVKVAHDSIPIVPEGGKLEAAAMDLAVSCLKRMFVVP